MNSVVTAQPDALPEATSISLSLPETLTFEQWEAIGAELANRAKKLNWWIGDWWAAGHHRYGERARLAARGLFGKEFKTLANIASVCRAFEPPRRREHLSWSHHAEAAALSPNAADMLLDLAERDRMSKAQVRAAVTTIRGTSLPRPGAEEASVATIFKTYNRLPGELRIRVAQAFAAAAATGAEIDPSTGELKVDAAPAGNGAVEGEPHTALELETDMARAEPEAAWELAADMAIPAQSQPSADEPFDLAAEMAMTPEADAPLDLDADMVILAQPEAPPPEALDLAAEMIVVQEPEPPISAEVPEEAPSDEAASS